VFWYVFVGVGIFDAFVLPVPVQGLNSLVGGPLVSEMSRNCVVLLGWRCDGGAGGGATCCRRICKTSGSLVPGFWQHLTCVTIHQIMLKLEMGLVHENLVTLL
jgi:hypothetical protein